MVPIFLRQLRKTFGSTVAVDRVDLDIEPGQLFFLLGPSGCGKTTLLRMVAGFTDPTSGTIRFGDRDVTHVPPHKRNAGMVFQGYALWPHMTVRQNVAFGLEVRKVAADQRQQRVDRALASVRLDKFADRKPNQLSGGQQQRVALARALVIEPTVLLLDEPLSNLDAKLRLEMRSEITRVCGEAGITAIYVTHDQKEALSMADAVAVMRDGLAVQVGPPRVLYQRPQSRFVADFLGETNFLSAEIRQHEGDAVLLDSALGPLRSTAYPEDLPGTGNVTCSIRPETIHLDAASPDAGTRAAAGTASGGDRPNRFAVHHDATIFLGEMAQHRLIAGDGDNAQALHVKAFELNPRLFLNGETTAHAHVADENVVILSD